MKKTIPFFDLKRQYQTIKQEVFEILPKIFEDQAFILGDRVQNFETNIAQWIGVKYAYTVKTGTEALYLGLKALDIGPGDEVITPAYSFFASTGAILLCNAKPIFVDIDPKTYNMNWKQIEAKITKKTKAIMPVHLYGQCADMDPILEIAKKHNLFVIEDFAQSIGAKYKGKQAGSMGNLGATSFYPTKNLGAAGEGGLITTNDDRLADRLKIMRVHGMRERYLHETLGNNSRLDSVQCAYLNVKLKYLNSWVEQRNKNAQRYLEELKPLEKKGLKLPSIAANCTHVWNQFMIEMPSRDENRKKLTELGVATDIYYPHTIPAQKVLRGISDPMGWPVSESAAKTILALPIFPELTDDEQSYVIEAMHKVF